MTAPPISMVADAAWRQQSVWSQTANRLKRSLDAWRGAALVATTAGAVLATAATQVAGLTALGGKILALAAAVAVGLVPLLLGRANRQAFADWTRARSVSEALKSEVYTFLAGVTPYRGVDRDRQLQDRMDGVLQDAGDLLHHTAQVRPVVRALPPVHDARSYIAARLVPQIDDYYRPRAGQLSRRLDLVRTAQFVFGAAAVVLGAVAVVLQVGGVAAWIAVVTTVSASLTAHAAASRYDYQLVEFLRTATELDRIRLRGDALLGRGVEGEDELVLQTEHVVSIQNEGWMAKMMSTNATRRRQDEPAAEG